MPRDCSATGHHIDAYNPPQDTAINICTGRVIPAYMPLYFRIADP
ncbi:Hypothetical protein ETEE_2547 [Edwardsiella anguillarum ET080813]|uniref:Uncharacterized protein n=1 Tax=Edwardsiella anguillarum ET080813 TaxID=667120 RepID=A0A076LKH8_9GAMM|nr:Hypothetical protein ETEE_2547 [Edwardsiella anguillarum ET080813]